MRSNAVYTWFFLLAIALLVSVLPRFSIASIYTCVKPYGHFASTKQHGIGLATSANLAYRYGANHDLFVAEGRGYGSPPSHGAPSNSPSYDRAPIAQPPSRSSGVMHYNSYDGAPLSSPPEQGRWVINPPEHQTNDVSLPLHEQVAHPELVVKEGRGAKAPVDETAPSLAPE